MPTKKTTKPAKKVAAPKKAQGGDLKNLRADLFSLKMKHALRELKEVHKLRQARKAVARHLTQLNKSK
ncbi:50S ribosomal protein L29 [Candidatus Gracilibacteria bacterium]|jgi:ribosomal protein L29|nr:50S ribosomal protein L29 [Candidatus Gracilibacteria bacterium]